MAVIHGSKADVFINGFDGGDWFNTITSSASKELNDRTVLNNSGYKMYHARMKEATISCSGFYDAGDAVSFAANTITDPDTGDKALSTMIDGTAVGTANDCLLHFPGGALAVGDNGWGFNGAGTTYEISGGSGELLGASIEITSCVGRERVKLAKLLANASAAAAVTTGTAIDNTVLTSNGGSAYLMVTDWTSGSLPVIVEHSVDNVAWSTLGTFVAVASDHQFERIEFSGTVNRYVRYSTTLGTFNATFTVAINRNA